MRDLFDRLKRDRYAVIQELIDARVQESVQLEFKRKEDLTTGILSKNDRRSLGPALSAFANSAGGLLIWGIQAARDPTDGVDAAHSAQYAMVSTETEVGKCDYYVGVPDEARMRLFDGFTPVNEGDLPKEVDVLHLDAGSGDVKRLFRFKKTDL
jgi:hypothetical protein